MPEKILYYLGAGASAKSLPLARSVMDGNVSSPKPIIEGLADALQQFTFGSINNPETSKIIEVLKSRFKYLAGYARRFGDVDTYAKYLYLKQETDKFKDLKQVLSQYFAIRQRMQEAIDTRYLSWLVSIMNRTLFPENVKILSWNYDFQIEIAMEHFGDPEDVNHTGTSFAYSPSRLLYYPNLDPTFSDFRELSLIHLNGIAGFARIDDIQKASIFQPKFKLDNSTGISFLHDYDLHSYLHFAWEKDNYIKTLMDHVKGMIAGTTIMVVIGYSFPFFNREIDKEIFKELKQEKGFRKIYYQDPALDGQQLKAQFELPYNFDIVHVKNTNNFHIPFEF